VTERLQGNLEQLMEQVELLKQVRTGRLEGRQIDSGIERQNSDVGQVPPEVEDVTTNATAVSKLKSVSEG
jgi:hypothetical protein